MAQTGKDMEPAMGKKKPRMGTCTIRMDYRHRRRKMGKTMATARIRTCSHHSSHKARKTRKRSGRYNRTPTKNGKTHERHDASSMGTTQRRHTTLGKRGRHIRQKGKNEQDRMDLQKQHHHHSHKRPPAQTRPRGS